MKEAKHNLSLFSFELGVNLVQRPIIDHYLAVKLCGSTLSLSPLFHRLFDQKTSNDDMLCQKVLKVSEFLPKRR